MTSLMLYVPSFCVSTLQSTQFMSIPFRGQRKITNIANIKSSSLWPINLALDLWQAHNFRLSRPSFFQCSAVIDRYVYMVIHNMFVVLCQKIKKNVTYVLHFDARWDLSRRIFLESDPAYNWGLRLNFTCPSWRDLRTLIIDSVVLKEPAQSLAKPPSPPCQIGTYVC